MTAAAPDGAYIRGGAVVPPGWRRLRRVLILLGLTVLVVTALVLTVDGAREGVRIRRLEARGQVIQVTVSSCLGLAAGTGMTPVGYTCRGSFTLDGHRYDDVIHGTSSLHPVGQTLTGITDPADRGTLFTLASFQTAPAPWRNLVPAAVAFAVLLLSLGLALRLDPWTWPSPDS